MKKLKTKKKTHIAKNPKNRPSKRIKNLKHKNDERN